MSWSRTFILKVKRAETPFYAWLKRTILAFLHFNLPMVPPLIWLAQFIRVVRMVLTHSWRRIAILFYHQPLLHGQAHSVGKRLNLERCPTLSGVKASFGDDVTISGKLTVMGGRVYEDVEFIVGNRTYTGHNLQVAVCQRVEIGDDVFISTDCYIADNPGHPKDAERRIAKQPSDPEDIKPVRICSKAWIGRRCIILPGVTIGEGAIVGAGSVVTKDVPPYSVAVGNPARVVASLAPSGNLIPST